MALVFQEYGRSLFPWMTVRDNVELPLKTQEAPEGRTRPARRRRPRGRGPRSTSPKSYPWQLSGGMQQRVAIARAVAYQPEVLIMDEPFAAVDAQTRADLEDLVRDIWTASCGVIDPVRHPRHRRIRLPRRARRRAVEVAHVVQEDLTIDLPAERDQIRRVPPPASPSCARTSRSRSNSPRHPSRPAPPPRACTGEGERSGRPCPRTVGRRPGLRRRRQRQLRSDGRAGGRRGEVRRRPARKRRDHDGGRLRQARPAQSVSPACTRARASPTR